MQERMDTVYVIPPKIQYKKYTKIGGTNFRTNIWYKVKNKDKIPFGNHVPQEEKDKCTSIKIIFTCDKDISFWNRVDTVYSLAFIFFIDSRKFGLGGYICLKDEIEEADVQKEYKKVLRKTVKIIKALGLKIDKQKMNKKVKELQNEIKQNQKMIKFLKGLKNGNKN